MAQKINQNPFLNGVISGGLTAIITIVASLGWIRNNPEYLFSKKNGQSNVPTNEQGASEPEKNVISVTSQENLIIETVKKASPAVVSIIISKDVPIVERYYSDPFGSDPFEDFFGPSPFRFQVPEYRQQGTEKREVGGGSGFIVSPDGYIVTNKHVVEDQDAEYTVFLNDDTEFKATVLARDSFNDVAILKIEAKDLPFLEFADSSILQVGQSVIAIGNPLLRFSNSVSVGVVSGLARSITASTDFGQAEQLNDVIQTDAAINPGNSGGPLLNLTGKVIGVNVAMASAENIGFALPGNMVSKAVDSVKQTGKIIRPYIGVRYIPVTKKLKEANTLPVDYGVLVSRGDTPEELAVIPGSPADKAGITENDIILEADGQKLTEDLPLALIVNKKNVGDVISLKILHRGEEKVLSIVLEEFPQQ